MTFETLHSITIHFIFWTKGGRKHVINIFSKDFLPSGDSMATMEVVSPTTTTFSEGKNFKPET